MTSAASSLRAIRAAMAAKRKREMAGVALLAQRQALGLTQLALANTLGYHVNTIARAERGEIPVTKRLQLAVRALRVVTQRGAASG